VTSDSRDPRPPLRADAARNRARVLAAAEELFAEEGAHAQLLDIAKRAGVGAGTVHRHFPTKDALFAEVIAARTTELLDQAAALPADRGPAQAFFAFWALVAEQAHRNAALCDAFTPGTAQQLRIPETLRARFERTLADMLKAAQAAGAVRTDLDADDAIALLSASVAADQRREPRGQPGRLVGLVADALRPSAQPPTATQAMTPRAPAASGPPCA
jgi:AcrR family transcriptional regulator